MDHTGVSAIELPECAAIAALRGFDERGVSAARLGGGIHGRETWRIGLQLKVM